MTRLFIVFAVLIVSLTSLPRLVEAVPIIDSVDNKLIGATDVTVNGINYDVSFIDDFSYPEGTGPTFTTLLDARAASQALLDYVLIGVYDTAPTLTRGITLLYNGNRAFIVTAYELLSGGFRGMAAVNTTSFNDDITTINASSTDYSDHPAAVLAVWTESAAPVPEPSTVFLLGSGLAGLAWYRRKRKNL